MGSLRVQTINIDFRKLYPFPRIYILTKGYSLKGDNPFWMIRCPFETVEILSLFGMLLKDGRGSLTNPMSPLKPFTSIYSLFPEDEQLYPIQAGRA